MYAERRAPLPVVIRDELGEVFAASGSWRRSRIGALRVGHRAGW
jgi:hypothetical protein